MFLSDVSHLATALFSFVNRSKNMKLLGPSLFACAWTATTTLASPIGNGGTDCPPPAPPAPTAPTPTAATTVSETIVDIAVRDGRFTQLVAAVTSANLVGDLSGPGPLTVFAPRAY
jgi:uncharacterized surface protein with fasciclin (FAS1) repeats